MTEVQRILLSDTLKFTAYFFKFVHNKNFEIGRHHEIISSTLKKVLKLEITRLIINLPPRYSKTEMVKNFIAQGFAFNPASKFIYTSYSEKLALDNSESVRDIIRNEEYNHIFGVETKKDSDSKSKWYTTKGGGVYATSAGGQITGFGAGDLKSEFFSGALIIDDPMKPLDANSIVVRDSINRNYDETLSSRLNSEKTPIIIIMQRLHANDLTGYLLDKEPEKWHVLTLPALQGDEPLWPEKHSIEDLHHLRKARPYVFYPQYQQEIKDIKTGGEALHQFKDENIRKLTVSDDTIHISIDNNLYPYVTTTLYQIKPNNGKYTVKLIKEILARDPDNSAPGAGEITNQYLKSIGCKGTVYVYGDPTTQNKSTNDRDKKSFYEKYIEQLDYNIEKKMSRSNKSVARMIEYVNDILEGERNIDFYVDESCNEAISDIYTTKKDVNGGILKVRIKNPHTQITYEKNGHIVDTIKDFLCQAFKEDFKKWQNKDRIPRIVYR